MASEYIQPLPAKPNLAQQQKLAKDLLRAVWAQQSEALERFNALHPKPPALDEAKLADAQLVIARGYGFPSWAKLKDKIDSLTHSPVEQFAAAVKARDVDRLRELLVSHSAVRDAVNQPLFDFGRRAVHCIGGNLALLDLLIVHGADINALSNWGPGGFTLLDEAPTEIVDALIARGAKMTPHAAAKHNRLDDLRRLLDAEPSLAKARGGDGQHPLHVAQSVEAIDLLVARGADVHARDVDHTATPAQYLAGQPALCRRLLEHGAEADLFMAARLGNAALAREAIERNPDCVNHRLGRMPWTNHAGGHIYNWVIGHDLTPYQAARKYGHDEVAALILQHCSLKTRLLEAIWDGDATTAKRLISDSPELPAQLNDDDRRLLPRAAWWYRPEAVRIALELSFDPHIAGVHDSTPLDRAAFHGYADIIELLLAHDPDPPIAKRNAFGGTPLSACIHGALHGWQTGHPQDHVRTVELLLDAGSQYEPSWLPTGHDGIDLVLRRRLPSA